MPWIEDTRVSFAPSEIEAKPFPWWIFLLATPLLFIKKKE